MIYLKRVAKRFNKYIENKNEKKYKSQCLKNRKIIKL